MIRRVFPIFRLPRFSCNLVGKREQSFHHRVDIQCQMQHFSVNIYFDKLGQVSSRNSLYHSRNRAHLNREVVRHDVHIVRQICLSILHAGNTSLSAKYADSPDFQNDSCTFVLNCVTTRFTVSFRVAISPSASISTCRDKSSHLQHETVAFQRLQFAYQLLQQLLPQPM